MPPPQVFLTLAPVQLHARWRTGSTNERSHVVVEFPRTALNHRPNFWNREMLLHFEVRTPFVIRVLACELGMGEPLGTFNIRPKLWIEKEKKGYFYPGSFWFWEDQDIQCPKP